MKLDLFFKLSYLSSNLALTLGYLNPASNNPAQSVICFLRQNACYLTYYKKLTVDPSVIIDFFSIFAAYTTFFIMGLLMSMQVPFVGFQPIRTSEHMAAAGRVLSFL